MRHLVLMFGILAASVAGGVDPPLNVAGACLTPQGTLCRTIRWEDSGWENVSWGFHALRRWSGGAVLAYRRDGAILERYNQRNLRNYFIADGEWDRAQIKFPLERRTIEVDHFSHEYWIRPNVPGGSPVWDAADSDCSKLATAFLLSDLRRVGEAKIVGIRSIEYTGLRPKGERWYVWLAPSLGCTRMKDTRLDHHPTVPASRSTRLH